MSQAASTDAIKERALEVLKQIYDPEIPVDIYELGLIYELEIGENGLAHVKMTLTSPACPVAESLPAEVHQRLLEVEGIRDVDLQLVWSPPWSKERMSDSARLVLNMF